MHTIIYEKKQNGHAIHVGLPHTITKHCISFIHWCVELSEICACLIIELSATIVHGQLKANCEKLYTWAIRYYLYMCHRVVLFSPAYQSRSRNACLKDIRKAIWQCSHRYIITDRNLQQHKQQWLTREDDERSHRECVFLTGNQPQTAAEVSVTHDRDAIGDLWYCKCQRPLVSWL